jgi:hypothetical protein
MAEEVLVKEALTSDMIALGSELTKALDEAGWPVVAVFWLYDAEANDWRLVVASPTVAETGPLAGYRFVGEILDRLNRTLPLNALSVVAPNHPVVHALASSDYARRPSVGRRVSRTVVNRQFVDDAYLYRLMPVAPAA